LKYQFHLHFWFSVQENHTSHQRSTFTKRTIPLEVCYNLVLEIAS
jgi:hypothetical protein